ncbi:hypothetical protein HZA73_05375 [candidate division TA06 bacterium]|nr:hypothetical protein [candidate division TA06 bacterium]
MKYTVLLLLTCLVTISCAPAIKRFGYRETTYTPLLSEPKIIVNGKGLTSYNRIEQMAFDGRLTIDDAIEIIKKEYHRISAHTANVYSIEYVSDPFLIFWKISHFKAYVDFYAEDAPPRSKLIQDSLQTNN